MVDINTQINDVLKLAGIQLNESEEDARLLSDEQINKQFDDCKINNIDIDSDHTGRVEVIYPSADDNDYDGYVIYNYFIYDDGKIALDNWVPDETYVKIVNAINEKLEKYNGSNGEDLNEQ